MNVDRTDISDSVSRSTVRSVSKILLAALALVFVAYLVTLLPGVGRLVPETPVTFAALAGAVVTVALVALLFAVAPKLASLVRESVDGPRPVVENVASVVYWLVVLVAVLVAHGGLAGVVAPLLEGYVWLYDIVFLAAALPAVVVIAVRLYDTLDPGADLVADAVAGDGTDEEGATAATATPGDNRDA